MSAYEDGKSFLAGYLAGLDQYLMVVSSGRFVLPHKVTAESLLNELLAALPPSIVVDGRVVGLEAVVSQVVTKAHAAGEHDLDAHEMVAVVLDAAREAADGH